MPSRVVHHPDPAPLETDDVRVIQVGTAAWALGLLVLLALRLTGTGDVRTWWMGMCGYGIALGLFGIRYARRRRDAMARDAAQGIPPRS